jgi:hypothetical protein
MKAVLALWAERSWESTGQMALDRTRIARSAPREPATFGWDRGVDGSRGQFARRPGCLWFVLVLQKKISPPPGESSAAGAGPSWVGGTRAMPSGVIWGWGGKGERPRRWCSQLPIGRSPAAISY